MSTYRQPIPNKREEFIARILATDPIKSQQDLPEVKELKKKPELSNYTYKKVEKQKPKMTEAQKRKKVKRVFISFCTPTPGKIDLEEIKTIWLKNKNLLKNISEDKLAS